MIFEPVWLQWVLLAGVGTAVLVMIFAWLIYRHKIAIVKQLALLEQQQAQQALELLKHQCAGAEDKTAEVVNALAELEASLEVERKQVQQTREQLAASAQQIEQLQAERATLLDAQRQLQSVKEQNARLHTELEQQRLRAKEQLALLADAKQNLVQEFENTANRIFEEKTQKFTSKSKETLEYTLNPLKQQLSDFRKRVDEVYSRESADRNRLVGQITELQRQTQKISQDAINLTQALKGDNKAQGNWGEVVLERLLEESGLQKGREYETQVALKTELGNRRNPDVIIRLPEKKDIIVDAKVSLVDYERYCSTDDAEQKKLALKAHIQSMRTHISGLSVKDYEKLEGVRTLDFIFIFVPIEAAFMLALQEEPALFREAYDKHIILVSPTTLLATLRTVENIWRYEKQNKNAERIAQQAGGLYDQFVLLLEAFEDVGKAISRSQEAYDKAEARLRTGRGNLIKRVEDVRKLGAKTKRRIKGPVLEQALEEAGDPGEQQDAKNKLSRNY